MAEGANGSVGNKNQEMPVCLVDEMIVKEDESCALSDEIKVLRERISLTDSIHRWLREIEDRSAVSGRKRSEVVSGKVNLAGVDSTGAYLWNSEQDCRFAHKNLAFDRVCHVFHLEWFGIRAAAGSLPGAKLGISASTNWNARELRAIGDQLSSSNISVLVIHGMSKAMQRLVEILKRAGGFDLYLVWHGNTAQWANHDELQLISMVLELNRRGMFRRVHAIRSGMEMIFGENAFVPQLLNMPPSVSRVLPVGRKSDAVSVLCPSWNDLRKNLHSNLLAATLSDRVRKVFAFADNLDFPFGLDRKVQILQHRSQAETIDLMAMVDLVSNVTVIDCHPMVNLEALAVGTPTLEGPLFLDALEEHPYKKLVRVENPLSVSDIKEAITSVMGLPEQELHQMMEDYRVQLTQLSGRRYLDFLELSL